MKAVRLIVLALGLSALGCDVAFIEPNPPVLENLSRMIEHPVVDEPVVYAVLLDLHIPDPVECQSAIDLVLAAASSFLPPGRQGMALGVQEIAPGCAQPAQRRIDLAALEAEVQRARDQYGVSRVRPVFLYANNVALRVPQGLREDLQALRALGPVGRPAMVFGVGSAPVLEETFEASVAWTFSADPRLRTAIETTGTHIFPFRSRLLGAQVQVLTPEELGRADRMLWCNPGPSLVPEGFTELSTAKVDPLAPPTVRSSLPETWLEWSSLVQPASIPLEVQLCTANCLRYVDDPRTGNLTRWANLTVCVPPESNE